MTTAFPYILTEDELLPEEYKKKGFLSERLNNTESLAKLGLKSGNVEGLLFIIAADGANYRIEPGNDKLAYDTQPIYSFKPKDLEKMADSMNINIKFFQKYYHGVPRAIVHINQEEMFLSAIKKLGYAPAKISEELF